MKRVRNILRWILVALYLFAAGGIAFRYLQPPKPPLEAQEFLISLTSAGYVWPTIGLVFFTAAILLLINRTIGLALLLPLPIFLNFLLYHVFLDASLLNASRGLFAISLHITCLVLYRDRFSSLFERSN